MKKVIKLNNKKFLMTSFLKLKATVNILGFNDYNGSWGKHVTSVNLPIEEFNKILKIIEETEGFVLKVVETLIQKDPKNKTSYDPQRFDICSSYILDFKNKKANLEELAWYLQENSLYFHEQTGISVESFSILANQFLKKP